MKQKKTYILYIVGILYLGTFYPAYWTSILVGRMTMLLHILFLALWAITVGYYCKWQFLKLNRTFNIIYFIICVYYLLRLVCFFDLDNLIQIVRLVVFYIDIYVTTSLVIRYKDVMTKYLWFHVVMLALTMIGVVLFAFGLLHPLGIIEISTLGDETLLNFGLYFVKLHEGATDLVDAFARPAGYYDEPGSLGLVVLLLLIYNKIHVKNKLIELLLLLGAYVSMSMAYIAASVVYVCVFFLNRKYLPILFFLIVGVGLFLSNYEEGQNEMVDFVYSKTIGRVEKISSGDDHSRNYEASFEAFLDNWLIGGSMEALDREHPDSTHETIWYFLAQHGILGAILLFSPLWIILLRKIGSVYKKSLLILLVIIYQRPDYFQPLYLTIIYLSFYVNPSPTIVGDGSYRVTNFRTNVKKLYSNM